MISFADIASAANGPQDLKGEGEFKQPEATYPNGTHICEVEIDPDTGITEIVKYTVVDDFGVILNPVLLAGQVHGGIVHGIGQCLNEHVVDALAREYGIEHVDMPVTPARLWQGMAGAGYFSFFGFSFETAF